MGARNEFWNCEPMAQGPKRYLNQMSPVIINSMIVTPIIQGLFFRTGDMIRCGEKEAVLILTMGLITDFLFLQRRTYTLIGSPTCEQNGGVLLP